jgi:cation transport regulator
MPYASNADLPPPVRRHLPARAQDLYRQAFNHAWTTYGRSLRREEIAHRTAWAAVKRAFHKGPDGMWLPNAASAAPDRPVTRPIPAGIVRPVRGGPP